LQNQKLQQNLRHLLKLRRQKLKKLQQQKNKGIY
jgi:hypothetical protein